MQSIDQVKDRSFTWNTSQSITSEVQSLGPNLVDQTPINTPTPQQHSSAVRQPIKFSNGMTPPPRSSSRNAVARVNLTKPILDDGATIKYGRIEASDVTEKEKTILKRYNSRSHSRHFTLDTINTSVPKIMDLPHAVTTPDESAVPAISPSYSLDLEDVPEEEEGYFFLGSSRSITQDPSSESSISPQKSMKSLQSWGSRSTVSDCFSSPCSPVRYSASRKRETGGPTLITSFVPDGMGRRSYQFKDLDCSWEDDIDFCYENAAEADCDFDWQSPSGYESSVGAALRGEIPFGGTLCTSQANVTAIIPDTRLEANDDFKIFPTKDPSKQLSITSEFMEDITILPKSQCLSVSANTGIGVRSAQSVLNEVDDGGNSQLFPNIGKISAQIPPPRLLFSQDANCPPKNSTATLNGISGVEDAIEPALHFLEPEKLGPSKFTPKISKPRFSRSSSFESILQPYSELPTSIRSSGGSFDCMSDLAKSRSNTIT